MEHKWRTIYEVKFNNILNVPIQECDMCTLMRVEPEFSIRHSVEMTTFSHIKPCLEVPVPFGLRSPLGGPVLSSMLRNIPKPPDRRGAIAATRKKFKNEA